MRTIMNDFLGAMVSRIGRSQKTLLALAIASVTLVQAQETRPAPTPITRDEVWQAVTIELRQRGVPEEQLLGMEEIDLPGVIPASASRTLRVSMVCWDADLRRAQFQLECREPGQCVPFIASRMPAGQPQGVPRKLPEARAVIPASDSRPRRAAKPLCARAIGRLCSFAAASST